MAKGKTSKNTSKVRVKAAPDKSKRNAILGAVIGFAIVLSVTLAYGAYKQEAPKKVAIQTAKGPIVLDVYPKQMPVTVANFEKLVQSKFYDGLTFHRVEDWVIQGGDPKGDGTGGPGWTIPLETSQELKNVRGAVAMARGSDPNSAGSQFYILKKDMPSLDGQYAVFGKVVEGMDIVDEIQPGDKMESVKDN